MNPQIENWSISKSAVDSEAGVVASQHRLAAAAGASMLTAGGNAIDAAVACAFALATVEPWMCGLGGSGYMVIWRAAEKSAHVLDFQGMLPADIRLDDYPLDPEVPDTIMGFPGVVNRQNVVGYRSITVPGAVKGLCHALEKFANLELDKILEPAIQLADRGLACDWFTTLQISLAAADLRRDAIASHTYLPNVLPPEPEQFLTLGNLSATLKDLAENGPDSFYNGAIAQKICDDLQAGGSRIDRDDMKAYEVEEFPPLSSSHRGTSILTAGETSGGPRLIEALQHIENHLQPAQGPSAQSWKIYADALNKAWKSHKQKIGRATEVGGCTSHLSAVDHEGNMVALTYTLLNRFGSCAVLPQTGILMNNSVSYFDPRPGYPTTMAGHKRINASNMSPTIAVRNNEALFAVGASGANYIMPCTMQIAALMLDFGLTLEEAFNHPRIDASDRGSVRVDPRLGDEVISQLSRDFELEIADLMVFPKLYSCPSGVSRDPETGLCHGINDPSQPIGGAAAPAKFELQNPFTHTALRP
ncbi:MAG: gamma-glutamyltransferase [Methyloligellaceae bacterium]